jgi:hypothetical protein
LRALGTIQINLLVGYLAVIEGGQQSNPPNAILQRLGRALGVALNKLTES